MARSWRFNLGVGFLLWLAALAVLAQGPTFASPSTPSARPVAAAMRLTPSDLQAELLRAAAHEARTVAYTQVCSSQRALRQCRLSR